MEIREKERQENEIRRYNQMIYRQVLDNQVKSKGSYPIPISLEPHLENRTMSIDENESKYLR